MQTVIQCLPDGMIRAVYTEALPLADFGPMTTTRASRVEFNSTTQQWEVRFCDEPDRVQHSNPSRAECISWEVAELNQRMIRMK